MLVLICHQHEIWIKDKTTKDIGDFESVVQNSSRKVHVSTLIAVI